MILSSVTDKLRSFKEYLDLTPAAKEENRRDLDAGLYDDAGIARTVDAAIAWLCLAQDRSPTQDGGVARHYSLLTGWGTSYPETTGYIVPTFITVGQGNNDDALLQRARRMLDWVVAIQMPGGGFQGGRIDSTPVVPVTFNTGQILLGLASGATNFGPPYVEPMHAAAQWLVDSQDADGCWRKHPTPFAAAGEKAYETHVAWGLLEAARAANEPAYAHSALRNVDWALSKQQPNGWIADCCLSDPAQPLTHTLGYALRGLLEAFRYTGDPRLLAASLRTGEGLLGALKPSGFLPGRLDARWRATVSWACLTGAVQVAHCWMMLFEATKDERFRDAAFATNAFVRRTVAIGGDPNRRGGVKGSFPVSGDYGSYEYLNWAAKFFVDANLFEQRIRNESSLRSHSLAASG